MAFSAGSSSSEINVTPLIDVLLVLLIIFMVIVPVEPRGLASRVPEPSTAPAGAAQEPGPVMLEVLAGVTVAEAPKYRLEGHEVMADDLPGQMTAAVSRRAEKVVFVRASPGLSFRPVAQAVGTAREAGATTVALDRLVTR